MAPPTTTTAPVWTAPFSRCFEEAFGATPDQYRQTRRIERAQELLRLTDLSVRDVCLAVGYPSLASFTVTFKRTVGMAPSAWREHVRAQELLRRTPSRFTRRAAPSRAV